MSDLNAKIGIVRFLGTNCDRDIWQAVEEAGLLPQWLWYEKDFEENEFSGFVIPGGFSYGDYLRAGALASRAPVMKGIKRAAEKGKPIIGICNGFQVLCEAELLPGALVQNTNQRFIDTWVDLNGEFLAGFWGKAFDSKLVSKLPIAHGWGRYVCQEGVKLNSIKNRCLFYSDNPNGSEFDIAGIANESGNVFGLMPHPERAIFDWMGSIDGLSFFSAFKEI